MKQTSCDSKTTMEDSDMNRREDLLQRDFRVLLEIYNVSIIQNEPMTYGRLYDDWEGRMEKQEFDESLDRLSDCGIIKYKYIKVKSMWHNRDKWYYVYYIADEAIDFAKEIYERVVIPENKTT